MFRTIGLWPALAAGLAGTAAPLAAFAQAGAEDGEFEVRVFVDDGQDGGKEKQQAEERVMRFRVAPPPGAAGRGGERRDIERRVRRPAPGGGRGEGPMAGAWVEGGRPMRGFRFDAGGPGGGDGPRGGGCDCCPDCPMNKGKARGGERDGMFEFKMEGPDGGEPRMFVFPDGGGRGGEGNFKFRVEGPDGGPRGMGFAPRGGDRGKGPGPREGRDGREGRVDIRGRVIIIGPDGEKREFDLPGLGGDGRAEMPAPPPPPKAGRAPKAPKPPRAPRSDRGPAGDGPREERRIIVVPDGGRGGWWSSSNEGADDDQDVIFELDGPEGFMWEMENGLEPAAETLPPPAPVYVQSEPI